MNTTKRKQAIMAAVPQNRLSVSVLDDNGFEREFSTNLDPAGITLSTDARSAIDGLLLAADAAIYGQIVSASIHVNVGLPVGLKVIPNVAADVNKKALFQFSSDAAQNFRSSFALPTYNGLADVSGSNAINPANLAIAGVIAAITTNGLNQFTHVAGDPLAHFIAVTKQFRK